jgi:lipopolysaccharide export LptBFGC system permease protein LptF
MLFTLWRAITFEFWRLLLLTVSVLVATISFAITIKPLADGKLSVDQAIRFMFYAIPPMLAYALPFAAGFAATITYHRMAAENEITAVYASGISHKKLLFPALASALLLASGMFVLNDQVIPRFLKEMERMVTQDFAKIFVTQLQSGQSAQIGSNEIHADFVERVPPELGSPVIDQYLLGGVALVKADPDGTVTIDGTAKRAWILLLPVWALGDEDRARINNDDATAVLMKFIDMTINREGSPITVDPFTLPAFPIPRVFKDDPKFMTSAEMKSLRDNPDQMNFVDIHRIELAKGIASTQAFREVAAQARDGRAIEFISPSTSGSVTVLAGGLSSTDGKWTLLPHPQTKKIEIEITNASGRTDRLRAGKAIIDPERASPDDPLAATAASKPTLDFTLALTDVQVLGSLDTDRPTTETASAQYTGLRFKQDPLDQILSIPSPELLAYAQPYITEGTPEYAEFLVARADRLEYRLNDLQKEILSKVHERWAMAGAALIMVLAGSVIALQLKNAQPLAVYQWSFFPALGTIVLISGGQQSIHNSGVLGIPVIYSGILILLVYTWFALRKVSRY